MTFAGFPPAASAPATWAAILATETLLRCWFRETGTPVPAADGVARLALADGDAVVAVPVRYRSPAGWHRFGQPYLVGGEPLDFAALAALLARDAARRVGQPDSGPALARLLGSARRIAAHLAAPRPAAATADPPAAGPPATGPLTAEALVADLAPPAGPDGTAASAPFLAGEQALVTGHPFHPAACDRSGAADDELAAYSPELGGTFQVHWFAAEPSVVRGTAIGGQGAAAATRRSWVSRTLRALAADARLPDGYLPIPAHPWQARAVLADPAAAELLADGRLVHLGPAGAPWFPTASLRTVWQPRSPVMLKLSLGLRITNSRRVNQPGELELAAQFAALFDPARPDGPGRWLAARHPSFRLVADPAWVGVATGGPGRASGLEVALRANPFGPHDPTVCAGALIAAGHHDGIPLARVLRRLAVANRITPARAVERWFAAYLAVLVAPVLDLLEHTGVGIEAHPQNTLLTLGPDGLPVAAWYRDGQGYYLAESRAERTGGLLPGFGAGLAAVFPDELVADRVAYYLIVNNVLSFVGALGAAGLADEAALLAATRAMLRARPRAADRPAGQPSVAERLADAPFLPAKANLLTCVDGRDELVGPVASQSVYVKIPNPLLEVGP